MKSQDPADVAGKRYTLEEMAKYFGAHTSSVRRWVREGRLAATRHGKRIVFSAEHIRQFEERESEQLREGAPERPQLVRRHR